MIDGSEKNNGWLNLGLLESQHAHMLAQHLLALDVNKCCATMLER